MFPGLHFPAGTDERFPSLRIELADEKNFHRAGKMLMASGTRRRLSMDSGATAKKACRNDARVVQDNELIPA